HAGGVTHASGSSRANGNGAQTACWLMLSRRVTRTSPPSMAPSQKKISRPWLWVENSELAMLMAHQPISAAAASPRQGSAAGQGARETDRQVHKEQELAEAEPALLGLELEILVVGIAGLVALPAGDAAHVGRVGGLEAAGADADDRMIGDHPRGVAPEDDTGA